MKIAAWTLVLIIAGSVAFTPALAAAPKVSNATLQRALEAMAPEMTEQALSATCVRTTYGPQTLQAYAEKQEPIRVAKPKPHGIVGLP